jgi:hypothetical protein
MSYIGNSPGVASQRIVSTFTATAGQTIFTPNSGYTFGYIDVYKNGLKLAPTAFTATNGITVILASGAALNDIVETVAYIPRGLSDWLYEIRTPSNVSPANGNTNITVNPTLTASPYYSLYGAAMTAAQWQVSLDQNFLNTVINTGDIAGTSVTYAITSISLGNLTTYYWRVRYKDANGVYSAWSAPTSFTTEAFTIPAIGAAYGGGYYAGSFTLSGSEYLLIVSPKAYGETTNQFKTSATAGGGSSSIDGVVNTQAATTQFPSALFCNNLVIGGYSDWYLPARKELEIIYYNLKPSTDANNTTGESNDYSVPPRTTWYSTSVPAQTSATIFRSGGAEAFASASYWSSTERNTTDAWGKYFVDGLAVSLTKTSSFNARAVRRILKPT